MELPLEDGTNWDCLQGLKIEAYTEIAENPIPGIPEEKLYYYFSVSLLFLSSVHSPKLC